MTRLIIVDDHQMFLDGLVSVFSKEEDLEVYTANTDLRALELLKEKSFDLAILDIELKGSNLTGVDLTGILRSKYPNTRILILSMFKTAALVEEMIAAGAHGYLPKDSGSEDLTRAVNALKSGQEYWDKELFQLIIDKKRKDAQAENRPVKKSDVVLTTREQDVLKWLAEGMSSKEIAAKLFIGTSTVDTHRKNMIAKFCAKNSTDVVVKAKEFGLL